MKKVLSVILLGFLLFGCSQAVDTPSNNGNGGSNVTPPSEKKPEESMTLGQKNALNSAKNYLSFMPFSKNGLITQLEFEGYSNDDAMYAVDHVNADWNDQARLKAIEYLNYSSFSKKGLSDQLKFEKFTDEQVDYGVNNIQVDWNEQAALKAQEYLNFSSFSRSGLIDQLLFEGFTKEQAEFGVSEVGY